VHFIFTQSIFVFSDSFDFSVPAPEHGGKEHGHVLRNRSVITPLIAATGYSTTSALIVSAFLNFVVILFHFNSLQMKKAWS